MVTEVMSAAINGIDSRLVKVEADISKGLPCFDLIGSLGNEVRESKERVRVAIKNTGINYPPMKITVNLAPADLRKEGTSYDLPIAIAVLSGLGVISCKSTRNILFAGELGLDGELRRIKGVLPMALEAANNKFEAIVVPYTNAKEAAVVKGIKVIGIKSLGELIDYLNSDEAERTMKLPFTKVDVDSLFDEERWNYELDYGDICGQELVKRAMTIAAAGFHNVLMIGPPGSGKTMAAKRLPTLLPPLSLNESMEVSKIYSVCGLLNNNENLIFRRPFVSPHHTISTAAMAGGGKIATPGQISRAHKGVLFLDEVVHFSSQTLEILRQPIEDKKIHIARTNWNYTFPADFMFVCAMNPCPCGYYPDSNKCSCTPEQIKRYIGRLSGPILDRIDICVDVPKISLEELALKDRQLSSSDMREKVMTALEIQKERFNNECIEFNSQMSASMVEAYVPLDKREREMMHMVFKKMNLSIRGYHKILKVARTIADIDEKKEVNEKHLFEAINYRSVEDKYFS